MSPIPVNLAVEDELSEAILRRLLSNSRRRYAVGTAYGRTGFGYLKKTIAGWNQAAKGVPFLVLTDLDTEDCPPTLLKAWLPEPKQPNLIFHVAVREVESWLLGDTLNLSEFLSCPVKGMPESPDDLPDPKEVLIGLARRSRSSDIRSRLVARAGSTAKQGPDYNACLGEFVRSSWSIPAAAARSSSLMKAVRRLEDFSPVWK